jgi:hypothetical protein
MVRLRDPFQVQSRTVVHVNAKNIGRELPWTNQFRIKLRKSSRARPELLRDSENQVCSY